MAYHLLDVSDLLIQPTERRGYHFLLPRGLTRLMLIITLWEGAVGVIVMESESLFGLSKEDIAKGEIRTLIAII